MIANPKENIPMILQKIKSQIPIIWDFIKKEKLEIQCMTMMIKQIQSSLANKEIDKELIENIVNDIYESIDQADISDLSESSEEMESVLQEILIEMQKQSYAKTC